MNRLKIGARLSLGFGIMLVFIALLALANPAGPSSRRLLPALEN